MPDPFATALDAMFASPMAVAAVYTPVGGDDMPIRAIRSRPSVEAVGLGTGGIIHDTDTVEMRVAEVPQPGVGDAIVIGTDSYRVAQQPLLDVEGLTWTCGIVPA